MVVCVPVYRLNQIHVPSISSMEFYGTWTSHGGGETL